MKEEIIREYHWILQEELIPAQGCTEPIALAYAAAKARAVMGEIPERCEVAVSGNIIKNVKSVTVPNTGGMKGIEASVAAGFVAGNADAVLEVVASIGQEDIPAIKAYLAEKEIKVSLAEPEKGNFYVDLTAYGAGTSVRVVIVTYHTNIVLIQKGEEILLQKPSDPEKAHDTDRTLLNVADIYAYADTADLSPVRELLKYQIACNTAVAEEGLRGSWGANIGRTILKTEGESLRTKARAWAAAGSDARMSGCELPVVIVSGSGNQGMTTSLPVVVYAKELGVSEEKLLRALALADLVTIHQKTSIGSLSAFCGATSAGCGAAAGITYLSGGDYRAVCHTVVNALGILSGMVCDGAKPSCAAKIAMAVEGGILGMEMYREGNQFYSGDGIISDGIENTIADVGKMARDGMRETDREILGLMLKPKQKID